VSAREAIANALVCCRLSEAQEDALDELVARHPATRFDVIDRDRFSCAIEIEAEDLAGAQIVYVTANGKVMPA
jgi:hypothetical protein